MWCIMSARVVVEEDDVLDSMAMRSVNAVVGVGDELVPFASDLAAEPGHEDRGRDEGRIIDWKGRRAT